MNIKRLKTKAFCLFKKASESKAITSIKRSPAIHKVGKSVKDQFFPQMSNPHSSAYPTYPDWIQQQLKQREQMYTAPLEPGLLSLVTTVWNTPVDYLHPLAESILNQKGGPIFEWVILDNGSSEKSTLEYLDTLKKHACVKLSRTEQNLGIIGGMRAGLKEATGRYIIPVDSDDYLYPDCLQILTWHIKEHHFPALLFSDEDKVSGDTFFEPYLKPTWDPVLFVNSCYIAHLCAIDRQLALKYSAYTDSNTDGSHDWDTFVRFLVKGHKPVHIPEVLYSWRVHAGSTSSGNMESKSYIHSSQSAVLNRFIDGQPQSKRYFVEPSPLFQGTPDWWIKRRHEEPRRMAAVVFSEQQLDEASSLQCIGDTNQYPIVSAQAVPTGTSLQTLAEIAGREAEHKGLILLFSDQVKILQPEWAWEALTHFELFPDTAMIGGRLQDKLGSLLTAGAYLGFGRWGCDYPDKGKSIQDPGYFAQLWKQKSVSAVSPQFAVVDAGFLHRFLSETKNDICIFHLGAWLGAFAKKQGKRVVYSPHFDGECEDDWTMKVPKSELRAFVSSQFGYMPEKDCLSPHLSLNEKHPYQPVLPEERQKQIDRLRR